MAGSYKVLGQQASTANTDHDVYTAPSGFSAIISTITVANREATGATYRIAVRPNGETLEDKHYLFYDVAVDRNSTQAPTLGITLAAGDVITVRASSSNVSFNVFGAEVAA